ncbi:NAD(P)-binding oxidoreductase [Vibrio rarus]|uniref:NAD(P)-binding oxidoreductase n=1 Tax=Vibrio rarus TaxID=413403 RepID=UPI0021C3F941|nr:NAD(P)-binding oxidoreductase [Vibrio rarus]
MKKVFVFGASSGLGAAIVDHFVGLDYAVTGVARHPTHNPLLANISTIACDATNKVQVEEAVAQIANDAWVISTMGSFKSDNPVDYLGHRYLVDALQAKGVKRFLLVTSLGCGKSWQYLSPQAKAMFGDSVREKSLAESWLQSSTLDYTILRPGGLQDGPSNGQGVLSQDTEVHGSISRGEVAHLIQRLLFSETSIGQIYQCVE